MRVVVSLGGSMIFKNKIDVNYLKKISKLFYELPADIAVTVGGGKGARQYVEAGRALKATNFELDEIAMQIVKANSRLLASSYEKLVYFNDYDEANAYFLIGGSTIVLGVATPGQTSDTTSSLFAEQVKADRWVNISNVDAIYNKDPNKFKTAKKFKIMTHKQLVELAQKYDKRGPRENFIVDVLASKILARSRIEAHFINGKNLKEVENAILGKKHNGTVVK